MGLKKAIKSMACLILHCDPAFPTITQLRYPMMNSTVAQSLISNLKVTIRPTSSWPETIVIVVTNENPFPVSFFRDYSPLDPLALRLGMLEVTPQWADKPLRLPKVRFNRPWPPPLTSTVTILPGTSMTSDFSLQNLGVHLRTLGVSPIVLVYGRWVAVWKGMRIDPGAFEAPQWAAASGYFVSNNMTLHLGRVWFFYS
ncbi:hypothetical protein L249_5086 [Ophiocordyceps polyrhachis-furcata BCC 54312]|uniref:Uncharacterized protein n=1 Tax=Ophiocordyceps polyrhachis-furcata BCC 54312 TaxID=1330021 RepID=A0A367L368_9HYPO|nr:hypothetical protein L249_5086 [Ophiocordyceps polyrhachis-furcata BCC 54312]